MYKQSSSSPFTPLNRGAFLIAGIYLLIGSLWILFSDRLAQNCLEQEMLANKPL
jgi:hypothetical protein